MAQDRRLPTYALGKELRTMEKPLSMGELLLEFPAFQYTVARAQTNQEEIAGVVDLDWHVERLARGGIAEGRAWSKSIVRSAVDEALATLLPFLGSSESSSLSLEGLAEFMVLLLLVEPKPAANELGEPSPPERSEGLRCLAHACPLPPWGQLEADWEALPRRRVVVLAGSGQLRQRPFAKGSGWVSERKTLERLKAALAVDEVLMCSASGGVLEGLTSNFVAVSEEGTIVTAPAGDPEDPEGVLPGFCRQIVLQEARAAGLPVLETAPNLWDTPGAGTSMEGFLCNAASLVIPVDRVIVVPYDRVEALINEENPELEVFCLKPAGARVKHLRDLVTRRLRPQRKE